MNPKRKMITVHFPFSFSFFSISPLSCASSSFLSCPSDRISRMSCPDVRWPPFVLVPRRPCLWRPHPHPTPTVQLLASSALAATPRGATLRRSRPVRRRTRTSRPCSLSLSLRARPVNGAGWDHFCQMKLAKATFFSSLPLHRFVRGEKNCFTYEVVLEKMFGKKTAHKAVVSCAKQALKYSFSFKL